MKINLYRGHKADGRLSMEIYAEQLERGLIDIGVEVDIVAPIIKEPSSARFSSTRWPMRFLRYVRFPRQIKGLEADIHHVVDHGYAHLSPYLGKGASCVTVHDLIPVLAARGELDLADCQRQPWLSRFSLSFVKRFDGVVTPSRASAVDVARLCDVELDRIKIIPPVIGDHFRKIEPAAVEQFASQLGLHRGPKWVMLSGQEFYKNHRIALAAISRLREQGIDLRVLKTGISTRSFMQLVEESGLSGCVSEVFLDDSKDLPYIYNFVDCLLFPSLYEGFGMPVAEAAACGTPVVTSDRGALREIQDPLIRHVSCGDVGAICEAVTEAICKPDRGTATESTIPSYRPNVVIEQWLAYYRALLA